MNVTNRGNIEPPGTEIKPTEATILIKQIKQITSENLASDSEKSSILLEGAQIEAINVSELVRTFPLSENLKDLPVEDQEKIINECVKEFEKAYDAYEKAIGNILMEDPKAKDFAAQLSQRMAKTVEASQQIAEEDKSSNNPHRPELNVILPELKEKLVYARFFGNTAYGSGSIGYNPLTIQRTIENGTLREQMTLSYCTVFSFILNEILKDKATIERINKKLKENNARFQFNTELIEKERKEIGKLLLPIERVSQFRERGRIAREKMRYPEPQGPKISEIKGLTLREARAGLEDYVKEKDFQAMQKGEEKARKKLGERHLKWISGKSYWKVEEESAFAKDTKKLGLPSSSMIAGPSGTSDGFLHMAKYVGLEDQKALKEGTKALVGWMVPSEDHSLHEILLAASDYGFPYQGKPNELDHLFDEETMQKVRYNLESRGEHMPTYYLSANHQHAVAERLGIQVKNSEPAEVKEGDLSKILQQALEGVPIPNDVQSIQMTEELRAYNLKLRQLEAKFQAISQYEVPKEQIQKEISQHEKEIVKYQRFLQGYQQLSTEEQEDSTYEIEDLKNLIRKEQETLDKAKRELLDNPVWTQAVELKQQIIKDYEKLYLEKVVYVNQTYQDNPVYAFAIPRTLVPDEDDFICAGGGSPKMNKLLEKGFVWDEAEPATVFANDFGGATWGEKKGLAAPQERTGHEGNEMGEKGHYFSKISLTKSEAGYLSGDLPVALVCKLKNPVEGASISSVSELKALGFSAENIDKGYRKLQKEYAFVQNAGLGIKETEVAILRPQAKLIPQEIITLELTPQGEIIKKHYIQDYFQNIVKQKMPKLHDSWTTPALAMATLKTGRTLAEGIAKIPPSLPPKGEKVGS
jgi:hypothetical protein